MFVLVVRRADSSIRAIKKIQGQTLTLKLGREFITLELGLKIHVKVGIEATGCMILARVANFYSP